MSELDLDALERELAESLGCWGESQSWAASYGRALIQRLREVEAKLTGASAILGVKEQHLREAEANSAFFEAESKTVTKQYGEALARVAQLERVREAGELYRIAVGHAKANEKPDSWAAWQHLDHLRDEFFATLAAMEEPVKP